MTQPNNTLVRFRLEESDDSGTQQLLRGKGRKREMFGSASHKLVHTARFGVTSRPPQGSQGIAVALNGNPDQLFVIHVEHPDHRPTDLAEGDTQIYGSAGNSCWLKADGSIVLKCSGAASITLSGGEIILNGDIKLGSASASRQLSLQASVDSAGHTQVSNLATKVWGE